MCYHSPWWTIFLIASPEISESSRCYTTVPRSSLHNSLLGHLNNRKLPTANTHSPFLCDVNYQPSPIRLQLFFQHETNGYIPGDFARTYSCRSFQETYPFSPPLGKTDSSASHLLKTLLWTPAYKGKIGHKRLYQDRNIKLDVLDDKGDIACILHWS